MIVPVQPPLEGLAAERFLALAQQLARCQERRLPTAFTDLLDAEVRWVRMQPHLNGCREAYEAASRVLIDLARLSWTVHPHGYSVELHSPTFRPDRHSSPDDIGRHKQAIRNELAPLREAQFCDESVRRFIRRIEKPVAHTKRKSILNLIADGRELYARLQPALAATGTKRLRNLAKAVQPCLQFVPDGSESEIKDEFTGIPLGDIWRYFRFTWVLPQLSIPGRQLLYLVRDAAHPCHAATRREIYSPQRCQKALACIRCRRPRTECWFPSPKERCWRCSARLASIRASRRLAISWRGSGH